MSTVFVKYCSYNYKELKAFIFPLLDRFVGPSIHKKSTVVIKPNFLAPAPPEWAILTHPLVLKAVAEYVIGRGARPRISDSNAMGTFEKVLRTGGFLAALEGLDVEFVEFKRSIAVDIGDPFGKIEIAEDAVNADVLINLPKLKTHSQMLLTLGVKNLFGCIVGLRKPEWHFRAGADREMFAKLLVKIHAAVRPSVTILDGITAMEGQGPGKSGVPRQLGILIGSDSAVAVDMIVCRMLGVAPDDLFTNRAALDMGFDEPIEVIGELPRITDFRLPLISPLVFGPRPFHGFIRRHLVQRPVVDVRLCKACGECSRYCPVKAIRPAKKGLQFDYGKCIRC
ncbi:MAG TPA: DUF362 domain-containing protein [Dissulfurispiraceae bacterium]|nr:DUF362 domain-containing protein [Dissulfurispiraceae bacterium]